jgi:uncharacterized protein (TIGR04255 family)
MRTDDARARREKSYHSRCATGLGTCTFKFNGLDLLVAAPRHLPNAPITEAVIDFAIDPPPGASIDGLEAAIKPRDLFGYEVGPPIWAGLFGIAISPGAGGPAQHTMANSQKIGIRAQSPDGKYVATFRTNGFGLSRLAPYESWDRLEAEARRLWHPFVAGFGAGRVTRVATRFINNLRLPMELGQSFGVYLNKVTDLPAELPQSMASFVQQFQLSDATNNNFVRVAVTWDRPPEEARVPVMLDIDAFRQVPIDPQTNEIWDVLGSLRELKNRCFFGLLTEEAIQGYL